MENLETTLLVAGIAASFRDGEQATLLDWDIESPILELLSSASDDMRALEKVD